MIGQILDVILNLLNILHLFPSSKKNYVTLHFKNLK